MLFTMKDALSVARENKFAIPAFNISSFEMFKAVIACTERLQAPVIIEIHPDELSFIGDELVNLIKMYAYKASVPVVLHLDHGGCLQDTLRAMQCGFTSVMIDGSSLSYEENLKQTKEVVKIAHALHISVEAELGTIGNTGLSFEGGTSEITYTDPIQAKAFVEESGIDSLAVAIGTAHGLYPKDFKPELNLKLLDVIQREIKIPLVLHGGSGNPDEEVEQSVELGVCKVNISSDIKSAYFTRMKEYMSANPTAYEPNAIFPVCMEAVEEVVEHKLKLLHTIGKASLY